jgi:hypothetical protein
MFQISFLLIRMLFLFTSFSAVYCNITVLISNPLKFQMEAVTAAVSKFKMHILSFRCTNLKYRGPQGTLRGHSFTEDLQCKLFKVL